MFEIFTRGESESGREHGREAIFDDLAIEENVYEQWELYQNFDHRSLNYLSGRSQIICRLPYRDPCRYLTSNIFPEEMFRPFFHFRTFHLFPLNYRGQRITVEWRKEKSWGWMSVCWQLSHFNFNASMFLSKFRCKMFRWTLCPIAERFLMRTKTLRYFATRVCILNLSIWKVLTKFWLSKVEEVILK